jgi:AGCS family alanine or glycine:cation symporter
VLVVGLGAVAKLDFVWSLSDTFNGLMAIPNLIGLLALSPVIVKETRDYFTSLGKGEEPIRVQEEI